MWLLSRVLFAVRAGAPRLGSNRGGCWEILSGHAASSLCVVNCGAALLLSAGGDSVSALKGLQPAPHISYISTGGGAGLELIRGATLPGIQALADRVLAAPQTARSTTDC